MALCHCCGLVSVEVPPGTVKVPRFAARLVHARAMDPTCKMWMTQDLFVREELKPASKPHFLSLWQWEGRWQEWKHWECGFKAQKAKPNTFFLQKAKTHVATIEDTTHGFSRSSLNQTHIFTKSTCDNNRRHHLWPAWTLRVPPLAIAAAAAWRHPTASPTRYNPTVVVEDSRCKAQEGQRIESSLTLNEILLFKACEFLQSHMTKIKHLINQFVMIFNSCAFFSRLIQIWKDPLMLWNHNLILE